MNTSLDGGGVAVWGVVVLEAILWGALAVWSVRNLRSCESLLLGAKQLRAGIQRGDMAASSGVLGPELQELLDEVQKVRGSERALLCWRAARNLAVIELEWRLDHCRRVAYTSWRTSAAVSAGAAFTLALVAPGAAAISALAGFATTTGIFSIGRVADRTRRRAREEWNALIRALEGTFTTG